MVFQSAHVSGYRVHVLQTDKYKTNTVVVNFRRLLDKGVATAYSLLPHVLLRGSKTYPTHESLMQKLGDLYGASIHADVRKKGDYHIAEFAIQVTNETFLSGRPPLLEESFKLLGEVLFQPLTENGGFEPGRFAKEKEQHRKRIESVIDDKIAYAAERCLLEMCKGERYGVPRLGTMEDLEKADPVSAHAVYQEMVSQDPVDVYVVGAVSSDVVAGYVTRFFPERKGQTARTPSTDSVRHGVKDVRHVVDRMDVSQGKLNIGCRTQVDYADSSYPALLMYNGILGGFPTSKLFTNVREKASLAYYASSRLESHKGILYVQSGIEVGNFDKAQAIIQEQFEQMRNGTISDEEIHWAKQGLVNQYRELMDSAYGQIDVHYNGVISGAGRTLEELEQAVGKVTKDQIVAVAQNIQVDTVYFLRDKEDAVHETASV